MVNSRPYSNKSKFEGYLTILSSMAMSLLIFLPSIKMDTPSETSILWGPIISNALARIVLVLGFRSAILLIFFTFRTCYYLMEKNCSRNKNGLGLLQLELIATLWQIWRHITQIGSCSKVLSPMILFLPRSESAHFSSHRPVYFKSILLLSTISFR